MNLLPRPILSYCKVCDVCDRQTNITTKMHDVRWRCIRAYVYGPVIILVLVWRKSIHFWRWYVRKKRFLHLRF